MELKVWRDKRYQVAAESIQCAADREGCEVFPVQGMIGPLLVLAHDEREAKITYQDEVELHRCLYCGMLNCTCRFQLDDDED